MAIELEVFPAQGATLLFDEDYGLFLLDAVQRARRRVLATQFLVELRPEFDGERYVLMLCRALAEASWRGVDVRIVLSRFVGDPGLDVNGIARRWLQARGVPVRVYQARPGSRREELHTKLAVVDDDLGIVSSHNWTPGAFVANREAAIAVRSRDVAGRLAEAFEGYWEVARRDADGG
jgi:phosphatidylserine/phosphatidylglycerophosphate/cardiolipin synthase-like enzyme